MDGYVSIGPSVNDVRVQQIYKENMQQRRSSYINHAINFFPAKLLFFGSNGSPKHFWKLRDDTSMVESFLNALASILVSQEF